MNPRSANYAMPAEWAEHERTLISWPVQDSMVYPDQYEEVSQGYKELIRAIAEFEPVGVIVNPEEVARVRAMFTEENIEILPVEHSDAWLRDNGPTFLLNPAGQRAGINWNFNAWGEKYKPFDLDNQVAGQLLSRFGITQFDAPITMEGGSFHVDGEGTLITTEECLLNDNRNPHLSREEIEQTLKDYLNVDSIIWLKRGLSGDETDGHVDNVACFAAPGKVILQVCDDPTDENYEITRENLAILEAAVDAKGRKIEVIPVQQPPAVHYEDSRLTLSYLNFYFVNGGIILPVFGGTAEETDRLAKEVLERTFPDRRVRTINGMAVIREGGNVHCTTQQMPAGK
ncbi:agmatine deiminase [Paenibacillus yonginensis]|uniref:Agmatine deiminase n=1 Tax=Paenibacillus yonginensis TaxID=1462996 RepID=A0A1B1N5L1_9BACL|nr:agmatine deiminase family protein [Paenibacillus yonginensis]ANS76702.1 agmatine deiminase [Paenibacillus yonginensis]